MKKGFIVSIILNTIVVSTKLFAQEEFIEPPSKKLSTIKFLQLTGGTIIMQALLNNLPDTLNFVLDSGSSGISLDSSTIVYLGLKPIPTDRNIRTIAGIRNVSFLFNQQLHFPGLTIDSLNFHVNDYSILTAVYGERIDGIIGYSVFSRYIIKIDYDSSEVEFWSKGSLRYPRGGYLLKPSITNLATQTVRVRDAKTYNAKFLYDIGAGLCMMLSQDFVNDSSLLTRNKKLFAKEGEGVGGKIDMHATVIKEVKIGPFRFRKVPVYIFDDTYNVTSYPYLGGLLGNDIMRRFNVIMNYDKRDFYIVPNSRFDDPFDYSYCGMELYLINGQIIAGDVAKDSPAEKAGVKEGDIVVAINKNFSQNMNQYKILLQSVDQKIQLVIKRNKELIEINFKIGSLL
jgi:hypothetical protein